MIHVHILYKLKSALDVFKIYMYNSRSQKYVKIHIHNIKNVLYVFQLLNSASNMLTTFVL